MDAFSEGFDLSSTVIAGDYFYVTYVAQEGQGFDDVATCYRYRLDAVQNTSFENGLLLIHDGMGKAIKIKGAQADLEAFNSKLIDALTKQ